jgi:hypothetical protein
MATRPAVQLVMPIVDFSLSERIDPVCRLADETGEKIAFTEKTAAKKGVRRVIFFKYAPETA